MNTSVIDLSALVAKALAKSVASKPGLAPVAKTPAAPKAVSPTLTVKPSPVPVPSVPKPITVSPEAARMFFAALRTAGMVINDQGRKIHDPGMVRRHEASAIEAFCGYNPAGFHGSQLDEARRLASRTLDSRITVGREYSRGSTTPEESWVPGMPDNQEKQRMQLEALIREAVEEKCLAYAAGNHAACHGLDAKLGELRGRLVQLG